MLFTTSINLAVSRSVRGRNSGVDSMQRENESACDQLIREENGFYKKKGMYDLLHFLEGTLLILITYHPRNGMKNKV